MSKSNKIVVYDNHHYFSRFLKSTFGKEYEFVIFKKFTPKAEFNIIKKNFSFVFFIIYSDADLYDFIKVYGKGVSIIVASFDIEILKKLSFLEDVILFDISLPKATLINQISNLLDLNS